MNSRETIKAVVDSGAFDVPDRHLEHNAAQSLNTSNKDVEMKKTTYTIGEARVFVLTETVTNNGSSSVGGIAEFNSLDKAIAAGKALQAATPNSELNVSATDTHRLSDEERKYILLSAINTAELVAAKSCMSPESAALSVVEASLKASEAIAQHSAPLVRSV